MDLFHTLFLPGLKKYIFFLVLFSEYVNTSPYYISSWTVSHSANTWWMPHFVQLLRIWYKKIKKWMSSLSRSLFYFIFSGIRILSVSCRDTAKSSDSLKITTHAKPSSFNHNSRVFFLYHNTSEFLLIKYKNIRVLINHTHIIKAESFEELSIGL